jgi:hypothetical protein
MTALLQVLIGPVDGSITQDITSHVLNNTVKVEDGAGALLSTTSFDVLDKEGTLTGIGVEREVIVNWDGVLIHRGIIKTCARVRNRSVFWRYYKCKTQDLTCLMADNVVTGGWPMGAYGPPDHNPLSDSATIDMLLATYGTHGVLGTVAGAVQTLVAPGSMPYIDFMSMTLYRAMAAICQVSGGHFWVDDNRVLHYAITETNPAPWGISDTPNYRAPSAWSDATAYVPGDLVESDGEVWTCVLANMARRPVVYSYWPMLALSSAPYWESLGSPSIANTFPYETLTLPDDTVSLANAIFIGGTGIYGFVEDSGSIAAYGRHEDGVRDTSVKDMLRFNAVGNAMLDQNKYPVQAATLTHRKPGLRAGMVVNLTDHVWGLVSTDHGIDFLISKIITTPDPSGIIEQELQVSPAWGPWSGS